MVKIDENYAHEVCNKHVVDGTIEPQIKEQWFVDVNKEFTDGAFGDPGVSEGDTVSLKIS